MLGLYFSVIKVNDLSLGKDYVDTESQKYTLDVCRIEAESNIDMKSESFRYQSLLAEQMGLMIDPVDKGLKISGIYIITWTCTWLRGPEGQEPPFASKLLS